jgi:hypothetical protein
MGKNDLMNTEEAIAIINNQINRIPYLKQYCGYESKENTKWLFDTVLLLEEIFGKNSSVLKAFGSVDYEYMGSFEYEEGRRQITLNYLNLIAYKKGLDIAQGLLESAVTLLKRKGIDNVYEGKNTPKEASESLIVSLIENSLRKVIRKKPINEIEVQDAIETLFIGAGLDSEFVREKEHIEFSSKTYIPDFTFKKIDTIVEAKYCDKEGKEKALISQINDDIVAYQTKYQNLIFVIYDIGIIRDIDIFKKGIEKQSIILKVIKH